MKRKALSTATMGIVLLVIGTYLLFFTPQPVTAYPEFAVRTGETCAACHFNPAGGGPRTPRGEIWVLDAKPNIVAKLPNDEGAVTEVAEIEVLEVGDDVLTTGGRLYELFACDGCHGIEGEGNAESPPLNTEIFSAEVIVQTIRTGPEEMPAIPQRMLDGDQMDAMVAYVQHLASGRIIRVEILDATGPKFDNMADGNEEQGGSE